MSSFHTLKKLAMSLARCLPYSVIAKIDSMRGLSREESPDIVSRRVDFYKSFVKEGDLVFDVGANYGNRVFPLIGCGSAIVAVEPQVDCVRYLRYRFGNRISIEQACLADNEGVAELFVSSVNSLSTLSQEFKSRALATGRFGTAAWSRTEKVRVTTLDKLIEKYGVPKFVKIDTEGFEKQVILGLTHPIPMISFEYTLPEMEGELREILGILNDRHAVLINHCIGEEMAFSLEKWLSLDEFLAYLNSDSQSLGGWGDVYVRVL